jgi:hypothetical protein
MTGAAALVIVLAVAGCAPPLQTQMIGRTTSMATIAAPLAAEPPVRGSTSAQMLRGEVPDPDRRTCSFQ